MLSLRTATVADVPQILTFIRELAEYEHEPDAVLATEEGLRRDGFGPRPCFHVVLAEWDGEPAGFALYFFNYSTWQGRPGLYLEDLFVRSPHRKKGIGRALLAHLAQIAMAEGCSALVWQVLDWNAPSIAFYESLGAKVLKEWLRMRLEGDALVRLAGVVP